MATVPSQFQNEPGESRCGNSFGRLITVSGAIHDGAGSFGSDNRHTISTVATVPPGMWWSNAGDDEVDFVGAVVEARDELVIHISEATGEDLLTAPQADAVFYLVMLANANLDRIGEIYGYWGGEGEHPSFGVGLPYDEASETVSDWPLAAGDDVRTHVPACGDQQDRWVDDQQLVFNELQTVRRYFCPGPILKARRKSDRGAIKDLLLDAARAIRCAQFGLWRMRLYNESLTEWEERYGGFGWKLPPAAPPPTPPIDGGFGLTSIPGPGDPIPGPGTPPLFEPADWAPPDAGSLPPPGDEPDAEGFPVHPLPPIIGPEGEGAEDEKAPLFSKKNAPLLLFAGAVGAFILSKGFK